MTTYYSKNILMIKLNDKGVRKEVVNLKLKLSFELEISELPVDYRRLIMSFFKHALESYGGIETLQEFYSKEGITQKPFTFAVGLFGANFTKDKISLQSNTLVLDFSTYDMSCAITFYNSFLKQKNNWFPLPNQNKMKLISVEMQKEKLIVENQIKVKMSAPLVVRMHDRDTNKDTYLVYGDEDFKEQLIKTIKTQLKLVNGLDEKLTEGFDIQAIDNRRTVIKHYSAAINGTIGKFILNGNPILLNYLYQGGIGGRSSSGFGFMELI